MSKYYKVDDVSRAIIELPNAENGYSDSYDKAEILNALESLPTIEVSEDCISREHMKSLGYINKGDFNSVETIREWIDNAPSVVPSRAEGEWIPRHHQGVDKLICECSNCHTLHAITNYCPNCGAKMKG